MLLFLLLAAVNLALILYIAWKRGVSTPEGVCMLYLAAAIVADHGLVLWKFWFQPDELRLGYGEFSLRVFPTGVHIVALLALYAGLIISDPSPPTPKGM